MCLLFPFFLFFGGAGGGDSVGLFSCKTSFLWGGLTFELHADLHFWGTQSCPGTVICLDKFFSEHILGFILRQMSQLSVSMRVGSVLKIGLAVKLAWLSLYSPLGNVFYLKSLSLKWIFLCLSTIPIRFPGNGFVLALMQTKNTFLQVGVEEWRVRILLWLKTLLPHEIHVWWS